VVENSVNINKKKVQKRVLIAPLDWGLGHATRCVPIITALLAQGFHVFIGTEKAGAALLKKEFSELEIIPLQGYRVSYSKKGEGFLWKMITQIPAISSAIKRENNWLKKIITDYKIDIVISDNRFGLYNKNVHCIFITHQLQIKTGNSFTENIAQKINYKYINRFNECWVIDEEGVNNLAGDLSHPKKLPNLPLKYIGALSRFKKYAAEKKYDLLAILSGPEPQRTIFENILIGQMQKLKLSIVLVRGLPEEKEKLEIPHFEMYNHLPAAVLNELILKSKIILARSGYTTVMDIAALQQKAIFIPTPGQTEQEYLATFLSEKKYCIVEKQDRFNLYKALDRLENTKLISYPKTENTLLQAAISTIQ
jgi:predicted glycosyltransferase